MLNKKRGLGKGLGALIPDIGTERFDTQPGLLQADIHAISHNPFQPRKSFTETDINDLAASIRERGILQPLLVSRNENGYELIAGERRLRAALRAGMTRVPVIVQDVDDRARQEIALIENIQREDLNIVEEAEAYQSLVERFGYTQEELAQKMGKSRAAVTNALRILRLSPGIKQDLLENKISMGHARAYLGLESPAQQEALHRKVVSDGLSVRQTENMINVIKSGKNNKIIIKKPSKQTSQDDFAVGELRKKFSTKVHIMRSGERGKIMLEFYSGAEFERIYDLLRG
jgi:ParB family transcriptional regulator, chromosome partitioning protein